jgi:hypothetical protein
MTYNVSGISFQLRDEIVSLLTGLAPPELAEPFDAGRMA